jgi:hypothetical protein
MLFPCVSIKQSQISWNCLFKVGIRRLGVGAIDKKAVVKNLVQMYPQKQI